MGGNVTAGLSWFGVATLASRAASFVAQIVLGRLLLADDFGVFAIAVSFATVVMVLRDGGMRELLVQRGSVEGRALVGQMFWIAMAFNVALGVVIAGASPGVAWFYGQPKLINLLLIMALSVPLSTFGTLYFALLRLDLRFRAGAMILAMSAIVKFGATIALALGGFGVYAFVWPWLLAALVEGVIGWAVVRQPLWTSRPSLSAWRPYMRDGGWLLASRVAEVGWMNGDYLVAGRLLTSAVLGVYYFGFQLVGQSAQLLSVNLQSVLLPALSRLVNESERFSAAVVRTYRVQSVWSGAMCFGLASVVAPLELVVWGGLWAQAVPIMMVLCIAFPLRVTHGLTSAVYQSLGEFKVLALLGLRESLLFIVGAAAGSIIGVRFTPRDPAFALAVATSLAMIISRMGIGVVLFRRLRIPLRDLFDSMFPLWAIGMGASLMTILGDQWVTGLLGAAPSDWWIHALRVVATGLCFTVLFLVGLRLLRPGHLVEAIEAFPDRFSARRRARLLLFLPIASRASMEPKADP